MAVLGELEQAVMDILWERRAPLAVRDVNDLLSPTRDLAYTTVMTVLDRLAKKGIVRRELNGRAWQYVPAQSRAELLAGEIVSLMSSGTPEQQRDVWAAVKRRMDNPTVKTA